MRTISTAAPRQLPPPLRRLLAAAALALAAAVSAPAQAGPYNTTSDGADGRLMLKGHDPVAYFSDGRHVPGKPDVRSVHDGVTYRFASAEHKAMFDREPAKYGPMFGGFCANGIAYGIPWGGDPDTWKIIDGRLYVFGGEGSKRYFLMDEARNVELSNRYWKDEVEGSIGIVQRAYRLVFRVPHYKTGKQLEDEYQSRLKAGQVKG